MKSKGLGHTSRGVLASVLVLATLLAAAAWVFERGDPPANPVSGPDAPPAPPTAAPDLTGDTIRVVLTRRPVQSIRLQVDSEFRLVSLGGEEERAVPERLVEQTVSATPRGVTICGTRYEDGVEIIPNHSPAVWVDGRQYRGSVRLHVVDGRLRPVNVLPLEQYIAGVVDAEMPAAFPAPARQAQAVVARSYAVSCRRDPPNAWFDLHATPVSQNYLGYAYRDASGRLLAGETAAGRAAAEATRHLVCTYRGRLFRTYYSACCGGRTVSAAAVFGDRTPPLRGGVACGGCGDAPLYRWERTAETGFDRLTRLARTRLAGFGSVRSADTIPPLTPAAAPGVELSDGRRSVRIPAAEVKSALDLPSLWFRLSGGEEGLRAVGRGYGHNVGLCQWGAKGLAQRGFTAERILKHYYPGCDLTPLE